MRTKDDRPKRSGSGINTQYRPGYQKQGRPARVSKALIRNFLICTGDMVKDQFGLFLFWKT